MMPNTTNPRGNMKKFIFIFPSTPIDFLYPHFIVGSSRYHIDWYEIRYYEEDVYIATHSKVTSITSKRIQRLKPKTTRRFQKN